MIAAAPTLEAAGLTCRHGPKAVVHQVDLQAWPSTLTAVLGPNGAGKSTLLRALAGVGEFTGSLKIDGQEVGALSRRELARRLALVPQDPPADVPFTVFELVLMGRAPHLGRLAIESEADREIARDAMRSADVLELAGRPIDQLSGGERRRVFLARALAQQPRVLLLDEPTAFLDLGHQARVMQHAAALARAGLCVLAVLHDPNLAAAWADQVLLMREGEIVARGAPREVLRAELLEPLYGARLVQLSDPAGAPFFGLLKT